VILVRDVMRPPPAERTNGAQHPKPAPAVYADETLREVANRFAVAGIDRALVVGRCDTQIAVGEIALSDLLTARLRDHHEEHHRERLLRPAPGTVRRRLSDRRGERSESFVRRG
jgi:hypothetical protein